MPITSVMEFFVTLTSRRHLLMSQRAASYGRVFGSLPKLTFLEFKNCSENLKFEPYMSKNWSFYLKWFIFYRNWFKITLTRNNQGGISLHESGSRSYSVNLNLTHSLEHKVQMIKSCSFKRITVCCFQAPILKQCNFWAGKAKEFLEKSHKHSVSWQQIRCFKILLMITLVLKKQFWKKVLKIALW